MQRATCLLKLGRLAEATTTNEDILKAAPENAFVIANPAQGYIYLGRIEDYDRLIARSGARVEALYSSTVLRYFEAAKLLITGDTAALAAAARRIAAMAPADKKERIPNWDNPTPALLLPEWIPGAEGLRCDPRLPGGSYRRRWSQQRN